MKLNKQECALVMMFGVAMLLVGCPPPHANPFDPDSPTYQPPAGSTMPPEIPARVRSLHTSRNIVTQDTYVILAEIWTEGHDPIDSAWVAFRDQPRLALRPTVQQVWTARLTAEYFNDPLLGSVIGQPFSFWIVTESDCTYTRAPAFLFRVIEATPVVRSPRDADTTNDHPILQWEPFYASFPFAFSTTVIRTEEDYEALIWTSDSLPSTLFSAMVPDSLENGDYYWTLMVSDEFENSSRSKEGVFTVYVENSE